MVNSVDAAIDAVSSGLGVSRLLSYQFAEAQKWGDLRRILIDHEPPTLPIHIIRPAGKYLPAKVALFIEKATKELRARFDTDTP